MTSKVAIGNPILRWRAAREYVRSSLWVLPTVAVLAALALGTWLSSLPPDIGLEMLTPLVPAVGPDGARSLLGTVAGAVITVTSLVFSLTVVALQLAASNYSPRLLRSFVRDLGNQVVLATFLATFAYSYAVLRTIRAGTDGGDPFVPSLAVDLLLFFVLASIAALVYFIHHLTQSIRVERILDAVLDETMEIIERAEEASVRVPREPLPDVPAAAVPLPALRSGDVQALELDQLARRAEKADVIVRLRPAVGDHIVKGTKLAWVWPRAGGRRLSSEEVRHIAHALEDGMQVGRERTMQQDVAYGVRQLVDIALRAISPAVNDPTTAGQAVDRLGVILGALIVRPLPNRLLRDAHGVVRVAMPTESFRDYLDLACDQIRHYGSDDPVLQRTVLQMLSEVRSLATTEERQRDIDIHVGLLVTAATLPSRDEIQESRP